MTPGSGGTSLEGSCNVPETDAARQLIRDLTSATPRRIDTGFAPVQARAFAAV